MQTPHHLHEFAVFICCVMQSHAPVAIISFPKMQYIWLIIVFAALKSQNAAFAVCHLFLGEFDDLNRQNSIDCRCVSSLAKALRVYQQQCLLP